MRDTGVFTEPLYCFDDFIKVVASLVFLKPLFLLYNTEQFLSLEQLKDEIDFVYGLDLFIEFDDVMAFR